MSGVVFLGVAVVGFYVAEHSDCTGATGLAPAVSAAGIPGKQRGCCRSIPDNLPEQIEVSSKDVRVRVREVATEKGKKPERKTMAGCGDVVLRTRCAHFHLTGKVVGEPPHSELFVLTRPPPESMSGGRGEFFVHDEISEEVATGNGAFDANFKVGGEDGHFIHASDGKTILPDSVMVVAASPGAAKKLREKLGKDESKRKVDPEAGWTVIGGVGVAKFENESLDDYWDDWRRKCLTLSDLRKIPEHIADKLVEKFPPGTKKIARDILRKARGN